MNTRELKDEIAEALSGIHSTDFPTAAEGLLNVLGYHSDLKPSLSGDVGEFISELPARTSNTQTESAFREAAKSAYVIFQITDAEIASSVQPGLFDSEASFDAGNNQSFVFVAVELAGNDYPRGKYAEFVREINKRFTAPTVVLFKTANCQLTFAFVNRRQHRLDSTRDVLGNVSLIRQIDLERPHRAHLDILAELSVMSCSQWMDSHSRPYNFDGLLDAWLNFLDTEELNRRFYHELFNWFKRAVEEITFCTDSLTIMSSEEQVIRLITRLMFVWFIKEKGLIPKDLFIETQVADLLRDYNQDGGDSYYRVVLQNLFFATLNTESAERRFVEHILDQRNFSLYRYQEEIADSDRLLKLFNQIPFINGGLFDCLDRVEDEQTNTIRIDCFTDNPDERAGYSIPNRLFFDGQGLITLFEHYKFTLEENTPSVQEVALDPELLGEAFENLLAAFNPETRDSARRQTGSYYTPRVVVDYMVDETLLASLSIMCQPDDADIDWWQRRLRRLLDYTDAMNDVENLLSIAERESLVRAIAGIKVLDPAVGSGAFPMSILHKLTLVLSRVDPQNHLWAVLQKEIAGRRAAAAFDVAEQSSRDRELQEISDIFEHYHDSDYGRKLYLIQNSIFGVDIQPIACQIAKLRFFISLAIEQESNDDASDNYGIRPLPNLETRFVAANTLIPLHGLQSMLSSERVRELQIALRNNRERHFLANTHELKFRCQSADERLRGELGEALKEVGLSTADADNIVQWDPYEQNNSAGWFDAEYTFGVKDGFDVVVGNPPYIQLQKNRGELGRLYRTSGYSTFIRTGDIYQLFYEKGCQLLTSRGGVLSYISSSSWLKAEYGGTTRRFFTRRHTPLQLIDMGKDVFDNAVVDSSILIIREGRSSNVPEAFDAINIDRLESKTFPQAKSLWGKVYPDNEKPWIAVSPIERDIFNKMYATGTPLNEWDVKINRGITTGCNEAFIIDNATKRSLIAEDSNSQHIIKPNMRGKDVRRYRAQPADEWIIATHNGYGDIPVVNIDHYPAVKMYLDGYYNQLESRQDKGKTPYNLRNCTFYGEFAKEKLFWRRVASQGVFAYISEETYCVNAVFMVTGDSLKFLCAVLNSKLTTWFMQQMLPTSGTGTFHWEKVHVERLPVPHISPTTEHRFNRSLGRVLEAKHSNPSADTLALEAEIDRLVYDLYGLTDAEVELVESITVSV